MQNYYLAIEIIYVSLWGLLFSFIASGSQSLSERILNAWYRKSRKTITGGKWTYVLRSRSVCDTCSTQIRTVYLIPVLGRFLCKGVCPSCHSPVPKKYAYTEAAAFIYGVANAVIFRDGSYLLFSCAYLFLIIIIISVDHEFFLIPLESIFFFILAGLIQLYYAQSQLLTLQIAFIWLILLYMIYRFKPNKLGMADVYLIFAMSLGITFPHSLYLPAIASITGIVSVLLFHIGSTNQSHKNSKQKLTEVKVPFGVYLGLSFLILRLIPAKVVF